MEQLLVTMLQELGATQEQMADAMSANMQWQQQQQAARGRPWDDLDRFKMTKPAGGQRSEWEEFYAKATGKIKARSLSTFSIMKYAENKMAGKELESDEYVLMFPGEEGVVTEPEEIEEASARLHRMVMEQTTADANAAVRRCRDENGLLAWKRLCANQNP